MANPWIMWENFFEITSTATADTTASGTSADNIWDWRDSSSYKWTAGDTVSPVNIISGQIAGNDYLEYDQVVVSGHNHTSQAVDYRIRVLGSDVSATGPFTSLLLHDVDTTVAGVYTFGDDSAKSAYDWMAVQFRIGTMGTLPFTVAPSYTQIHVGRKLYIPAGLLEDMDPYGIGADSQDGGSEFGAALGVNVRVRRKRFVLNYSDVGMTELEFFNKSTGPNFDTGFIPHAVEQGKPFWFQWNEDIAAQGVWLCKVAGHKVSMPFIGSQARRALQIEFDAWQEVP